VGLAPGRNAEKAAKRICHAHRVREKRRASPV